MHLAIQDGNLDGCHCFGKSPSVHSVMSNQGLWNSEHVNVVRCTEAYLGSFRNLLLAQSRLATGPDIQAAQTVAAIALYMKRFPQGLFLTRSCLRRS